MKAFNSYLEDVLVDLKNSKFEREEFAKMGKYIPISNKQKREEEVNYPPPKGGWLQVQAHLH